MLNFNVVNGTGKKVSFNKDIVKHEAGYDTGPTSIVCIKFPKLDIELAISQHSDGSWNVSDGYDNMYDGDDFDDAYEVLKDEMEKYMNMGAN